MSSERSRSTCGNGPQCAELLVAKPGPVLFSKAVTLDAKDVGHLHRRPTHLSFPVVVAGCVANLHISQSDCRFV